MVAENDASFRAESYRVLRFCCLRCKRKIKHPCNAARVHFHVSTTVSSSSSGRKKRLDESAARLTYFLDDHHVLMVMEVCYVLCVELNK